METNDPVSIIPKNCKLIRVFTNLNSIRCLFFLGLVFNPQCGRSALSLLISSLPQTFLYLSLHHCVCGGVHIW